MATLGKDEGVVIVSDHEPRPLHYQLKAMYGEKLEWTYLEQGPQEWRVRIGWARP